MAATAAAEEDEYAEGVGDDHYHHDDHYHGGDGGEEEDGNDDWDVRKVFVSRVPTTFDENAVKRLLETKFGPDSVFAVSILRKRDGMSGGPPSSGANTEVEDGGASSMKGGGSKKDDGADNHRGFAFVTFDTEERRDLALEAGTVRGGVKVGSKRKHTLYIRPLARDDGAAEGGGDGDDGTAAAARSSGRNTCHLWSLHRCPYGDSCKFEHTGDGGLLEKNASGESKKKQKCFAFKKKGKCKKGDLCPFSHETTTKKGDGDAPSSAQKKDIAATSSSTNADEKQQHPNQKKSTSEKDCLNWKTKGKCRKLDNKKGGGCPYRHDEAVREAALAKKAKRDSKRKLEDDTANNDKDSDTAKGGKNRQPLSVRVFGLNYDTTEHDVRQHFKHCGPIVEITFPRFEDSGRSKGYCGILFQSPKAVEKAVELHETELAGRWLSVQAGKMYLKQWEERERGRQGNDNRDGGDGDGDGEAAGVAASKEEEGAKQVVLGEFGQKVKKRRKHGHKE